MHTRILDDHSDPGFYPVLAGSPAATTDPFAPGGVMSGALVPLQKQQSQQSQQSFGAQGGGAGAGYNAGGGYGTTGQQQQQQTRQWPQQQQQQSQQVRTNGRILGVLHVL